jgi:3-hydroxyisobutyrate dehydrogenase
MEADAPRLMQGDDLTSFSLARCLEELEGALELGDSLGVPMAMGQRIAAIYASALQRYGDLDGELLAARYVAEQAGISLSDPRD